MKMEEELSLAELNKIMSSIYSYELLNELSKGLRVNEESLKRLNIKKRTLYQVLKKMRDLGIVNKKGSLYYLTIFGLFLLSVERELLNWLSHRDEIRQLSVYLSESYSFKLTNELLKNIENIVGVSNFEPVKIYTEWESLVSSLADRISGAEYEVKLMSRYIDVRVLSAMYETAKRGVPVYLITNKTNVRERIKQYLSLISNENLKALALKLFSLPNVFVRSSEVPYSAVIIDSEDVGLEVPNSKDGTFMLGLQFKSPTLASKLASFFNGIFDSAESDKVIFSLLQEVKKEWA